MTNRAADLRYAFRMIRKTPGASGIAVLSLALGIGANTAIFSLVDTMLLKLLPVRSPQELYIVTTGRRAAQHPWNYPDYVAMRDQNHVFTGLALSSAGLMPLGMQMAQQDSSAPTELVQGMLVSGNYFEVLGVEPAIGRLFTAEVDRAPGASPYAVLNYDYWRSRFQGDPGVLGRVVRLNGYPMTIIGVARRGFRSTDVSVGPNLYVPAMMRSEVTGTPFARWNNRHNFWLQAIGRLRPGVSTQQAEGELLVIYKSQEEGERRTAKDQRFVNKASPVHLLPAARGYSYTRNRLEKPLHRSDGGGRAGAADRLRQCREPDAGPRRGAAAGDRGAAGRRRESRTADRPTADGKRAAGGDRRSRGAGALVSRRAGAAGVFAADRDTRRPPWS